MTREPRVRPCPRMADDKLSPDTALTLDQLRVFLEVVDAGSFSAAARRLRRVQSAVSYGVAALERQLDVQLFDRATRTPTLTPAGRELAADARAVLGEVGRLRARAQGMSKGVEPRLSIAVDHFFPLPVLTRALEAFRTQFPTVTLTLHTEALGAVSMLVAQGKCSLGIGTPVPRTPREIERRPLTKIKLIHVAAPSHPLASIKGRLSAEAVREHVQIVLSDRSELTEGVDFGLFTDRTWRVLDLATKHALLRAGLGWGGMPEHLVAKDVAAKRLVRLSLAEVEASQLEVPLFAMHRTIDPPGPAARWLLARMCES